MSDERPFGRLRAAFKNATVWGVAWGALGTGVATAMRLSDGIPMLNAIGDGVGMGIRIGIAGAVTGAAFSAFVSLAYRGKRLREISPVRFGIGGAILAGLFVPAFLQTMNLLSGEGMVAWSLVIDDILYSTLFGGITAAGTMRLAQRDADAVSVHDLPGRAPGDLLGEGEAPAFTSQQREKAAEQY
ncbi:MAG: hypothetical protein V4617_03465 [Gemmatimonadota bacterium]